jgi:hypothetical protein
MPTITRRRKTHTRTHARAYTRTHTHTLSLSLSLSLCRDSVVGTATGYGLDHRGFGVRVPVGSKIFSSPRRPNRLWSHPASSYPMGTGNYFPGGKAAKALS